MPEPTFEKELQQLINRHSKENGSDTPDFMLAEYLNGCLENFNRTVKAREKWYGRERKALAKKDWPTSTHPDPTPQLDCVATEGGKVSLQTKPCCGK